MGNALWKYVTPAEVLLNHGLDVWQLGQIFEVWQPIEPNDSVQFALCCGDPVWVCKAGESEYLKSRVRRFHASIAEYAEISGDCDGIYLLRFFRAAEVLAPIISGSS